MLRFAICLILNYGIVSSSRDILEAERRSVNLDVLHLNLLATSRIEICVAGYRLIYSYFNISAIGAAEIIIGLSGGWCLGYTWNYNSAIDLNAAALIGCILRESVSLESNSVICSVIFIDVIEVATIASLSGTVNLLPGCGCLALDIYVVHIVGACETLNGESIVATIILLDKGDIGSLAIRYNEFTLHRLAADIGRDGVGAFG